MCVCVCVCCFKLGLSLISGWSGLSYEWKHKVRVVSDMFMIITLFSSRSHNIKNTCLMLQNNLFKFQNFSKDKMQTDKVDKVQITWKISHRNSLLKIMLRDKHKPEKREKNFEGKFYAHTWVESSWERERKLFLCFLQVTLILIFFHLSISAIKICQLHAQMLIISISIDGLFCLCWQHEWLIEK